MIVGGDEEEMGEIVRCRHPGCDLFFNNGEEVAEHIKREHTDEVLTFSNAYDCNLFIG